MKIAKYTFILALMAPLYRLNGQHAIGVQAQKQGSKKLEIGDCFGLKTYAGTSDFQSIEGNGYILKQYLTTEIHLLLILMLLLLLVLSYLF